MEFFFRYKKTFTLISISMLAIAAIMLIFEKQLTKDIILKKHQDIISKIEKNEHSRLFLVPNTLDNYVSFSKDNIKTYIIDFKSKSRKEGKNNDKGIKTLQDISTYTNSYQKTFIKTLNKDEKYLIVIKKEIQSRKLNSKNRAKKNNKLYDKDYRIQKERYELEVQKKDFAEVSEYINNIYNRS